MELIDWSNRESDRVAPLLLSARRPDCRCRHVAHDVSLVHRRVRFVVPASLGLLLLLPDGDAVAQHP